MAWFNPFDGVQDSIKDWLQTWFEKINPITNDFYNTMYWIKINPFDIPNSITAILTSLSILIIIVFWIWFLFQKISQYNQKQTAKKSALIIIFIMITLWIGSLFYDNNKEVTFNLHLIYKKSDNRNNTIDNMGYKDISVWNAFSEDPFKTAQEQDWWVWRTSIWFDVYDQLKIKWNLKYTGITTSWWNGLNLAVWVNPLIWKYADIVDKTTYLSQHDIYLSKNSKAVDSAIDICPQWLETWTGWSNWMSTFVEMLSWEDGWRVLIFKNMLKEDSWYKLTQCLNNWYRKDLIFKNAGDTVAWDWNKVGKDVYAIIPMYYPLDILNEYTLHNWTAEWQVDDFILKPTIQTWNGGASISEDEKLRNTKYIDFEKKLKKIGLEPTDFTTWNKPNIKGFDIEKFSIINTYNTSMKNNLKIYDENAYIDDVLLVASGAYNKANDVENYTSKINLKEISLKNSTNTGALDELEKDKISLEQTILDLDNEYSKLVSDNSNQLKVFSILSLSPSLAEFKWMTSREKFNKLSTIKDSIVLIKNNKWFYTENENKLKELLYQIKEFEDLDKTKSIKFFLWTTDLYQVLWTFFTSWEVFWKNLESADNYILQHICTDKKIDKINDKLTIMWVEVIWKEIIDCSAWTKGTIVDKSSLVWIFNKVIAYQYKKDKLKEVNLMTYYGKIVNKTEQKAFWALYQSDYDSTQPINIWNYTLISPLYYYKKLLDGDFNWLPTFLNLKDIWGKVYLQDKVYDMKLWSPMSWYKDLDGIHGDEYTDYLNLWIPVVNNILVNLVLLINICLFALSYLYIITMFVILLKSE